MNLSIFGLRRSTNVAATQTSPLGRHHLPDLSDIPSRSPRFSTRRRGLNEIGDGRSRCILTLTARWTIHRVAAVSCDSRGGVHSCLILRRAKCPAGLSLDESDTDKEQRPVASRDGVGKLDGGVAAAARRRTGPATSRRYRNRLRDPHTAPKGQRSLTRTSRRCHLPDQKPPPMRRNHRRSHPSAEFTGVDRVCEVARPFHRPAGRHEGARAASPRVAADFLTRPRTKVSRKAHARLGPQEAVLAAFTRPSHSSLTPLHLAKKTVPRRRCQTSVNEGPKGWKTRPTPGIARTGSGAGLPSGALPPQGFSLSVTAATSWCT